MNPGLKTYYNKQAFLIVLSLLFMLVNLITIYWDNIPWLDEVMITDTAVNFHLDGAWRTTAWYAGGEQSPFSTYPPLYQFLLVLWMKVFGFSQFACKSLNIFLTFILSILFIQFFTKKFKQEHNLTGIVFLCLFWLGGVFSTIYRFGRVDVLNILTAFLFLKFAFEFIVNQRGKTAVLLSSFFVLLSGIQACIFVVLVLFWSYMFYAEHRKNTIKASLYFVYGSILAMIFLLAFFYFNGHFFAFLVSLVSYSSTLKGLAVALLPILGPIFNLDVQEIQLKVASDGSAPSFFESLLGNYRVNLDFLFVMAISLVLVIFKSLQSERVSKTVLTILGFALFVPLFMSIAGRYVIYYTWMGYLPAILGLTILINSISKKQVLIPISLIVLLWITLMGFPKQLIESSRVNYEEISTFVKSQNFPDSKTVLAPFSIYYQLRQETSNCYFIGIYPIENLPAEPTFVFKDTIDYDGRISSFLQLKRDEGYSVTAIDSMHTLGLKLYKVE